jgi:hypothetical protein
MVTGPGNLRSPAALPFLKGRARRRDGPPNRDPDSPAFPAEFIGKRGFPASRFRPSRESGIPSPFPGEIGNRGNGNWGFPGLAQAGTTRIPDVIRADFGLPARVRMRP